MVNTQPRLLPNDEEGSNNDHEHHIHRAATTSTNQSWTTIAIVALCSSCLGILIGVIGYHLVKNRSTTTATVITPPLWPHYFSMEQNITTQGINGDYGRVVYNWEKRTFRAGHTNLFDTGCHFEYLWIKTDHYVYNDTFCCKYQFKSTLHVQAPDWLQISKHIYLGMQTVNNVTCRTWYSPTMQSFYWDRVIDGVSIPFRWDNNMNIEKWSAGALTTLFWNVKLLNKTVTPGEENDLTVPSHCTDSPALCPHRSTWSRDLCPHTQDRHAL